VNRLRAYALTALGLLLVAGGLAFLRGCHRSHQAAQATSTGQAQAKESAIHDHQAGQQHAKAEAQAQANTDLHTETERLRAEVAALRKRLADQPSQNTAPTPGAATPPPTVDGSGLSALVTKQDGLIQAQDRENMGIRAENAFRAKENTERLAAYNSEHGARVAAEQALKLDHDRHWNASALVGRDFHEGTPVYGCMVGYGSGCVQTGAGVIGNTAFVQLGVRW